MDNRIKIKQFTEAAAIASMYVVLTYITNLFGLANGAIQLRLSEALCILPAFTPSALYGLFIGCFVSNLVTGCAIFDVFFGSVATLIGACGTYLLAKRKINVYLYTLPPVAANSVILPLIMRYFYSLNNSVWYFALTISIGEIISCSVFGTALYFTLKKNKKFLFNG